MSLCHSRSPLRVIYHVQGSVRRPWKDSWQHAPDPTFFPRAYCRTVPITVPMDDTIVAISTPPGRGGIGVVRLSGPQAQSIAAPMLHLNQPLQPYRCLTGHAIEPLTREPIDEVVVTFFQKPHSYTTDDIIEISAHGSPVILRHLVE